MKVPLKSGWESRIKQTGAVYSQRPKDRKLIDGIHDDLHDRGCIEWPVEHSPTAHPIFVVWRYITSKTDPDAPAILKGRVVIDLRKLNQEVVKDLYSIPRQEDILAIISRKSFILTFDATSFFFQWRVAKEDWKHLCVVSHRGQERYTVAPMGFINSPAYVQRMDTLLRDLREFCKIYIDDIVIASETLSEYLDYLLRFLEIILERNIALNPVKAFVGFPSVILLGRRVDGLGLMTLEERAAAIADIRFPSNAQKLEIWIGLVNWFCHNIPMLSVIMEPLQSAKTQLLKDSLKKGKARKVYITKKAMIDNPETREAFEKV